MSEHVFAGGDRHRQCLVCRAQNPKTKECPGLPADNNDVKPRTDGYDEVALSAVIKVLLPLPAEDRARVIRTVAIFFNAATLAEG